MKAWALQVVIILIPVLIIFSAGSTASPLVPEDLVYRGAFRLPPPEGNDPGWSYGGEGMTYYPAGDPAGPDDGYPGSIFGIGNDIMFRVSEISIPPPVISPIKNPDELNTATTLQPFSSVLDGMFRPTSAEWIIGDIEFMERQGDQTTGKLYLTFGEHFQFEAVPSHGWCDIMLNQPHPAGPWYLDSYDNFATDDYLFGIPTEWADQYTPGLRLATGRYRDGSLAGSGPALFAFGPWTEGDPPPARTRLSNVVPLLLYGKSYVPEEKDMVMAGFNQADEWSGGAWVTAGDRSAVLFAGTKGRGAAWYGFANGVIWPDNPPYPEIPPYPNDDRGWWADSFEGGILFFDPDDLAKVAQGTMDPFQPQPYAELNIDPYLYHITGDRQKNHVAAMSYDRTRGILYLFEPFADGDQPLVHVFSIRSGTPGSTSLPSPLSDEQQAGRQDQITQAPLFPRDTGQKMDAPPMAIPVDTNPQEIPLHYAPIFAVPIWYVLRRKNP